MKKSFLVITLLLTYTIFSMEDLGKTIVQEHYIKFKTWNNETDSVLIDGLFLDNNHAILAKQNGVCQKYSIDDPKQSEVIFRWPVTINNQRSTLKNILYDAKSNRIFALSNICEWNNKKKVTLAGTIDVDNLPQHTFAQIVILKDLSQDSLKERDNESTPLMLYECTVGYIDPQFRFLSAYARNTCSHSIFTLRNNSYEQFYPRQASKYGIHDIAFHALKELCVMALVKKTPQIKNIDWQNDCIVKEEIIPATKQYKIKMLSTKNWTTLWKKEGRNVQNTTFNQEGTCFAYVEGNILHTSSVASGELINSIKIPRVLEKISSLDFENDSRIAASDAYHSKRMFVDLETDKWDEPYGILFEPEVRFSEDRTLKMGIDLDKVILYKKAN